MTQVATPELAKTLARDGFVSFSESVELVGPPLVVGRGQHVEGRSRSVALNWHGDGPIAIQLGNPRDEPFLYQASLRNFTLQYGGIHVAQAAPDCDISHVDVFGAPEHGLLLDAVEYGDGTQAGGFGEMLTLHRVTARDSDWCGCAISARSAISGLLLEQCVFQHNGMEGLLAATLEPDASANYIRVRDCVIQGNGANGDIDAEIELGGYVGALLLDGGHVESVRTRTPLRLRPQTFHGGVVRRPSVAVRGGTRLAPLGKSPYAVELIEHRGCWIDDAFLHDPNPSSGFGPARLAFWAQPGGAQSIYCPPPAGPFVEQHRTRVVKLVPTPPETVGEIKR